MLNPDVDRALCNVEYLETWQRILDCLTPEQTAVVSLLVMDNATIGEIAELLGVQRSTVSMRLRFARKRIRRALPYLARDIEAREWNGGG